jgi:DNA polymerase-3 subunit epsilon
MAIMREIVLDTETTGLTPYEGHRLVEIGAIEIVHQVPTGRVFHQLINPERDVPPEAAAIHGHTAIKLRDKPVFATIVDDILSFIGDAPLVIHNAGFDLEFLNAELARVARKTIEAERIVDTLALARKKHPGLPNSLDSLCDRYKINRSGRTKHGALLDAQLLAEVYCELAGGRQGSLSLVREAETFRTAITSHAPKKDRSSARLCVLELGEADAHAEYIRTLGGGVLWQRYLSPQSL